MAGRREWIGLGVLALATLAVSFDIFVLLLALPQLSSNLGATSTEQLWILDIYGFMVGGLLITMGSLGDRIGRRNLLLIGTVAFVVASVVAAYAQTPGMLIAARALLGVAGATLAPSTLSLISTMFTDMKQRSMAIGIWGSCFTAGAIIGPIAGGVMLEHFWWGSVFLLAVPAMLLLLVLGPLVVPEYRAPQAGPIDLPSVVLSMAAVLPAIYGIKELARHGWAPIPAAALVVGLAVGVVFVRRQTRLTDPILDVTLFKLTTLTTPLVSGLLYTMLTGTALVFVTQHLQSVTGVSPLQAALSLIPGLAIGTVGMLSVPILARRFRPAYLIGAGLVVVVLGLLLLARVQPDSQPVELILGFAVWSLGGAPLLALGMHLILGSAPPERAGSASSLTQVSTEFGYGLGIATVGTIGTAVYRAQLAVPEATPAEVVARSYENVAGAVAAAPGLPASVGAELLGTAREAFTVALNSVAGLSALVLAVVAVVLTVRLRHLPPIGGPQGGAEPVPEKEAAGTVQG
ncbi:MFS transporter [Nonomuraea sp. MG754425]|nr:MFS transporter [Nonomuraea sp. MG754425]